MNIAQSALPEKCYNQQFRHFQLLPVMHNECCIETTLSPLSFYACYIMTTTTLNIGRLINCRKKMGITKQQAAIQMHLSQPAYLRYESGERTPSIHVIYYIAHVLGTSAEYLMGTTDDPAPNTYIIQADKNPDLFSLIKIYHNSDSSKKERLLTYIRMLSE